MNRERNREVLVGTVVPDTAPVQRSVRTEALVARGAQYVIEGPSGPFDHTINIWKHTGSRGSTLWKPSS